MTPGKVSGTARDIVINALLVLAGVLLPLLALELYLRWDNRRPHIQLYALEVGGEKLRVVEPPDSLADLHGKAVILGDSFTSGDACGLERSYPGDLGRMFAQDHVPCRVLNLGVAGADPFTYLHLLGGLVGRGGNPQLVVVTLFSNDIELSCSVCRYLDRIRTDPEFTAGEIGRLESLCRDCAGKGNAPAASYGVRRRLHNWLLQRSYAYGLIRDFAVGLSMKAGFNTGWGRTAYPPLWRNRDGTEFKLLRFALTGIRDTLATRSRLMVVIYPDMENLRPDNEYVGIYRDAEADLARTLRVPVWSGYPAFLESKEARPNMSYSLVDHHPSCRAHELFARGVYRELKQAGFATPAPAATP